jgi:nitric oxide reductase NorQ protein
VNPDEMQAHWDRWGCAHERTESNTYKDGRCLTCKRERDQRNYDKRKRSSSVPPPAAARAAAGKPYSFPVTLGGPLPVVLHEPLIRISDHPGSGEAVGVDGVLLGIVPGLLPPDSGCGMSDPGGAGYACTAHRSGSHLATGGPVGKTLMAWPIITPVASTPGTIDMTQPALATCAGCDVVVASAALPAEVLHKAARHEDDTGHEVMVSGYEAGSTTDRRAWPVAVLRSAASAADAGSKPAAPAAPAAPVRDAGVITLASGAEYHLRTIADRSDVDVLRALRDAGLPVMLYGPPGAGKTTVVAAAFPGHEWLAGDGDTVADDFVGNWVFDGEGGYVWADGPLTEAMKRGVPLFVDDITMISPKVTPVLYSVMDGRGSLKVKAHQVKGEDGERRAEIVVAQPGFYIIGGHNPGVHGAILNEALQSRFMVHIHVRSDLGLARKMGVDEAAIKVAQHLATIQKNGNVAWVPQLRELLAYKAVAETLGAEAALANMVGQAPPEDRPEVADAIRTITGHDVPALELGSLL